MDKKSVPIEKETLLDDLHPARFLQVSDLRERWKVEQVTVTIARMAFEDTVPNPGDLDIGTADRNNPRGKPKVVVQPVIYFKTKAGTEWKSGYLLSSKVDVTSLKSATGEATVGGVIGKQVTVMIGEHKRKAVLRISPEAPLPSAVADTLPK